jgi:hypothetical protein
MNLCSEHHDEVCYEVRNCPVCDLRKEMDEAIEDLNREIAGLRKEIESLQ